MSEEEKIVEQDPVPIVEASEGCNESTVTQESAKSNDVVSATSTSSQGGWWGSYAMQFTDVIPTNISPNLSNVWSKAKETGSYVYEFTTHDLNEVAAALKQDIIVPSASAIKHQLQV